MTAARDVLCAALQPVRHVGCTRWAASLPTSRQPTCRSTNNVTLPRPQLPHSGRYRCDIWPVSSSSTGRVVNVRYWHLADTGLCAALMTKADIRFTPMSARGFARTRLSLVVRHFSFAARSQSVIIWHCEARNAHDNAERSKPSRRISGKRHGTRDSCGCGDNRGGVCLDGATSFVKCQARPRLALSGHSDAPVFVRFWTKADIGPHWRASHLCPDLARNI